VNAFSHFGDEDNSGILGRLMASLLNESSIITIDQRWPLILPVRLILWYA